MGIYKFENNIDTLKQLIKPSSLYTGTSKDEIYTKYNSIINEYINILNTKQDIGKLLADVVVNGSPIDKNNVYCDKDFNYSNSAISLPHDDAFYTSLINKINEDINTINKLKTNIKSFYELVGTNNQDFINEINDVINPMYSVLPTMVTGREEIVDELVYLKEKLADITMNGGNKGGSSAGSGSSNDKGKKDASEEKPKPLAVLAPIIPSNFNKNAINHSYDVLTGDGKTNIDNALANVHIPGMSFVNGEYIPSNDGSMNVNLIDLEYIFGLVDQDITDIGDAIKVLEDNNKEYAKKLEITSKKISVKDKEGKYVEIDNPDYTDLQNLISTNDAMIEKLNELLTDREAQKAVIEKARRGFIIAGADVSDLFKSVEDNIGEDGCLTIAGNKLDEFETYEFLEKFKNEVESSGNASKDGEVNNNSFGGYKNDVTDESRKSMSTQLTTGMNSLGITKEVTTNGSGQTVTMSNKFGNTVIKEYDKDGNLIRKEKKTTESNGDIVSVEERYNDKVYKTERVEQLDGTTKEIKYTDNGDSLTEETTKYYNNGEKEYTVVKKYDTKGNAIETTTLAYDEEGTDLGTETMNYDKNGKVETTSSVTDGKKVDTTVLDDGTNRVTSYKDDVPTESVTSDSKGNVSEVVTYNDKGKPIETFTVDRGDDEIVDSITLKTVNDEGDVTTVTTDNKGNTTTTTRYGGQPYSDDYVPEPSPPKPSFIKPIINKDTIKELVDNGIMSKGNEPVPTPPPEPTPPPVKITVDGDGDISGVVKYDNSGKPVEILTIDRTEVPTSTNTTPAVQPETVPKPPSSVGNPAATTVSTTPTETRTVGSEGGFIGPVTIEKPAPKEPVTNGLTGSTNTTETPAKKVVDSVTLTTINDKGDVTTVTTDNKGKTTTTTRYSGQPYSDDYVPLPTPPTPGFTPALNPSEIGKMVESGLIPDLSNFHG